jgi:hypothetical protein
MPILPFGVKPMRISHELTPNLTPPLAAKFTIHAVETRTSQKNFSRHFTRIFPLSIELALLFSRRAASRDASSNPLFNILPPQQTSAVEDLRKR